MAASTLNPNAPMFVPLAYRAVEDFSDEWWDLVRSSPWFRHFWIQDYNLDIQDYNLDDLEHFDDFLNFLDNADLSGNNTPNSPKKGEQEKLDLVSLGVLKWKKPRGPVETPKCWAKAPKIVNVRVNPRPIKQPR